MKSQHDPRHVARALALQHLFTTLIAQQPEIEIPELLESLEEEEYDVALYQAIVDGITKDVDEIDPMIEELAPAWPIVQIAPVDLILLRMGVWEGFVAKLNPAKVVINEMIELGREFGGESSSSFINGVLGNLYNQKKSELPAEPE